MAVDRAPRPLLCSSPAGVGEVGVVLLNLRGERRSNATAGIAVSVSLDEGSFDTRDVAMRRLIDGCVDALSADLALVGPYDLLGALGAGWATFARHFRRDLLPAGAEVVPVRGGELVLAHQEDPASESAAARDAIARVAATLRDESPERTAAPTPATPAPLASSPVQPTYLAEPPRRRMPAAFVSTMGVADAARGPALPFVPGTSVPLPAPRPRAPAKLTGTADISSLPRGPLLPFAAAAGSPRQRA